MDELEKTSAVEAARRLIGCELVRTFDDGSIATVRIVETEAYDQTDAASHSYNGRTPRTEVMFGQAGHLYVYFTYGMHYCCNVVIGPEGYGAAVLLRAVEPIDGKIALRRLRDKPGANVSNGPAKLCQALGIDTALNGHNLHMQPLQLVVREPLHERDITQTTRIGISKAIDEPWRFYEMGNTFVSKP